MSLWPAVWPDDLGIATACELWDEEDLMGLGPGIGAGSIEESLMEFWRRREEIDSRAAAREPEFAGDPTERERVRERANVERAARMAASVERNNTERSERLVALGRLVGRAIL